MKFLLIVLTIHLAAEVIAGKKNKDGKPDTVNVRVMHPAEFEMRSN